MRYKDVNGNKKNLFVICGKNSMSIDDAKKRISNTDLSDVVVTNSDIVTDEEIYNDCIIHLIYDNKIISPSTYRNMVETQEDLYDLTYNIVYLTENSVSLPNKLYLMVARQIKEFSHSEFRRTSYYRETIESDKNTVTFGTQGDVQEITRREYNEYIAGVGFGNYVVHSITESFRPCNSQKTRRANQ